MMFQIQAKINETNIGYLGCGKKSFCEPQRLEKNQDHKKWQTVFDFKVHTK